MSLDITPRQNYCIGGASFRARTEVAFPSCATCRTAARAILTGTAVILAGTPALAQSAPCFRSPVSLRTGNGPVSMLAADLNNDGKADLVTTNRFDHNLSILLNSGRGFASREPVSTGLGPVSAATGDFDGDGVLDLTTANFDSDDISLLLGRGDGSFSKDIRYPAGREPSDVVAEDFNGDKIPDLAVSCRADDSIEVRLGLGTGELGEPISAPTGERPTAVAAADFDADGNLDLLTANYDSNDVTILLGQGNGGFRPGRSHTTGTGPAAIAVLDFNRDGALDAVLSNATLTEGSLSILLGDAKGGFYPAATIEAGVPLGNVISADANDDGISDLIFGRSNFESSYVTILPLSADGIVGTPATFPTGNLPLSVSLADFNLDGRPDLATGNYFGDDISVLLGKDCHSTGRGAGDSLPEIADTLFEQFALGDQNEDGFLDFTEASLLVLGLALPDFAALDGNDDGRLSESEVGGSGIGFGCLPSFPKWHPRLSTFFLLGSTGTAHIGPRN